MALSWLRGLDTAGSSSRRSELNPNDFKCDPWRRGNAACFSPSSSGFPCQHHSIIASHPSSPHPVCDSPDQAAHYHTLGPKLGASSVSRHLTGLGVKTVWFHHHAWAMLSSSHRKFRELVTMQLLSNLHYNYIAPARRTQCKNLPAGQSWAPLPCPTVHLQVMTFHLTEVSVWNPEIYKRQCLVYIHLRINPL
jgi:hypothetical protein